MSERTAGTHKAERSPRSRIVQLILVAVLVGFAVIILCAFVFFIWPALSTLPAAVATPTFVGALTVAGSVVSVLVATRRNRMREIERDHRLRKMSVYREFTTSLFKMFAATKNGGQLPAEQEGLNFFTETTAEIILWGGSDMLEAWTDLQKLGRLSERTQDDTIRMLLAMGKILLAMRQDMGHSNDGLSELSILRLFITDIDEYNLPRHVSTR